MAQTVIGIFNERKDADKTIKDLKSFGFNDANIDMVDHTNGRQDNDGFFERIGNFFNSMFDDKQEASNYAAAAQDGVVVTVQTRTMQDAQKVATVMDKHDALNANDRAGHHQNTRTNETTMRDTDKWKESEKSIPVVEEELHVGKREEMTQGGVRVRSRIIERPVEETLRLREEHVEVERKPVDRPATAADMRGFQEGEIEMTERREVPVVSKDAKVVEEVRLNKEVGEREETIRDTVRRSDVDIEQVNESKAGTRSTRNEDKTAPRDRNR